MDSQDLSVRLKAFKFIEESLGIMPVFGESRSLVKVGGVRRSEIRVIRGKQGLPESVWQALPAAWPL